MSTEGYLPLPWDNPAIQISVAQKIQAQGLEWDNKNWQVFDFTDDEWVFLEWADFPVAIQRSRDLAVRRNGSAGLMQVIHSTFANYRRSQ